MTTGILRFFYDIAVANHDHYVDLFHRCHIPEKPARPGHRWSAHFEAPALSGISDLYRYVAMFGDDSTRLFLDLSPA